MRQSLETDPEIATLRNAVLNAKSQLVLARRGRWDVSLFISGQADLEGNGERRNASEWAVSGGVEVSAVDSRVTTSLARQAQADIARYTRAIEARENQIFVSTIEPVVDMLSLIASREGVMASLPRYQSDYDDGVAEYLAGQLNLDNLLTRRETLYDQQEQVVLLTQRIQFRITDLCGATGKFFELLDQDPERCIHQ